MDNKQIDGSEDLASKQTPTEVGGKARILNGVFDTINVKFDNRAEALAALGSDPVYDQENRPHVRYDGELLTLGEALTRLAYDRRDLVDERTLPREKVSEAREALRSKADFTDVKSKIEFIKTYGLSAWERLPVTSPHSGEVKTQNDWYRLTVAEKTRRLRENPRAFTDLPRR